MKLNNSGRTRQLEHCQTEITVKGMDCAGCARNVKKALEKLEGVESADVLLSSEKARIITSKPGQPELQVFKKAVEDIGYHVPNGEADQDDKGNPEDIARKSFRLFGLVFGLILLVVVAGEWLELFHAVTDYVPFWAGALLVGATGYPVFRNVVTAALKKQITPHALMALGALSALITGEWVTAAIVVFFMRTGDFIESKTTDKARDSIRSLSDLAPQTAVVIKNNREHEIPVGDVQQGDTILVRPGSRIPVDGKVLEGQAAINEASITGESMPVEKSAGSQVFASTTTEGGRLLIRAEAVGRDTTFGKIITLVEEAESQKGPVQRYADRFSAWYLPVVAGIALLTYLIRGDVMATVAVMVVACSCAFALATPVALLASIGSNAKRGLLIKGGKYIEALSRADVLLVDKTGTLTFGRPEITDIIPLDGCPEEKLLILAGSAEYFSGHPLAKAITEAAGNHKVSLTQPSEFEEVTGNGVKAVIEGATITVGSERLIKSNGAHDETIAKLKNEGKTVITVQRNGQLLGLLAARDAERRDVASAMRQMQSFGFSRIELLTGDNKQTARAIAENLGIEYRAELLPEEKIDIVRQYQSEGRTVVMVGDGVNDAPALAQADIGIAMGGTGTDVAIETADITLMRDEWMMVPELFKSARKTMHVIRWNFGFTTLYNVAGLSLAAFGLLPPMLAAAAQSLPDVGIMLNSSRLLRH